MAKQAFIKICRVVNWAWTLGEDGNYDPRWSNICRHSTANNSYNPNSDGTAEFSFFFVDNYGGVMQLEKHKQPIAAFAYITEILNKGVLDFAEDARIGYFLEIDVSYPPSLHDDHSYIPLAPTKDVVEDEWLCDYQIKLKEQHNLPISKVKKLR